MHPVCKISLKLEQEQKLIHVCKKGIVAKITYHLHIYPQFIFESFHILHVISLLSQENKNSQFTSLPMCGFIAHLVEHRTGIAEVTGSNPVEALIFFRLLHSNCLNWKFTAKITYHLHIYPQFIYESFHILHVSFQQLYSCSMGFFHCSLALFYLPSCSQNRSKPVTLMSLVRHANNVRLLSTDSTEFLILVLIIDGALVCNRPYA